MKKTIIIFTLCLISIDAFADIKHFSAPNFLNGLDKILPLPSYIGSETARGVKLFRSYTIERALRLTVVGENPELYRITIEIFPIPDEGYVLTAIAKKNAKIIESLMKNIFPKYSSKEYIYNHMVNCATRSICSGSYTSSTGIVAEVGRFSYPPGSKNTIPRLTIYKPN